MRPAAAIACIGLVALVAGCEDGKLYFIDAGAIPGNIVAIGGAHSDRFGSAIALRDDLMVVGSPGADENGPESGAVLVYTRSGVAFTEATRLFRPDLPESEDTAAWQDRFGAAVSLDGDLLVVGAPGVDDPDVPARNAGAVYIFQDSGGSWTYVAPPLRSPTGLVDLEFGSAVAVTADTLVVGAAGADLDTRDVGAVLVYRRSGTQFTLADDATASAR